MIELETFLLEFSLVYYNLESDLLRGGDLNFVLIALGLLFFLMLANETFTFGFLQALHNRKAPPFTLYSF